MNTRPAPVSLTFIERILYGAVFATSIAIVLAWSPLWPHLLDFTALFPARYAAVLDALPGAPNTALAFLLTLVLTYAVLFLLREPTAGLGAIAALALGTAAYPYGKVLWHRLFLTTPIDAATPTLGAWLRALVPVLLLLVPPVLGHIRAMKAAYANKETDDAEVAHLTRHLTKSSLLLGGTALGTALVLGLLVTVGSRLLASEARFLGRNSALVMLVVALLLVFALGFGTGLFGRSDKSDEEPVSVEGQDEAERA